MNKTIARINHLITAICLIIGLVLTYSLVLGRGRAIPEKIDYKSVRYIILTYGKDTRVLTTQDINEIEVLMETLAQIELKPGLAPVTPDPEIATLSIWFTRGKFENQYIFMENSVMQSQGIMIPHQYRLIDYHGMTELIRHIVSQNDSGSSDQ